MYAESHCLSAVEPKIVFGRIISQKILTVFLSPTQLNDFCQMPC